MGTVTRHLVSFHINSTDNPAYREYNQIIPAVTKRFSLILSFDIISDDTRASGAHANGMKWSEMSDFSLGFKYYVEAEDADILILTETKVHIEPAAAASSVVPAVSSIVARTYPSTPFPAPRLTTPLRTQSSQSDIRTGTGPSQTGRVTVGPSPLSPTSTELK